MKPRVPLKPPKMIEAKTDVDRPVDIDLTIETAAIPDADPTSTTDITGATEVSHYAGRPSATLITQRAPADDAELDDAGDLTRDDVVPVDEATRDDELHRDDD